MAGSDVKIRKLLCAALLVAPGVSSTVLAQVIPTPGTVQEQIRQQPALPTTPDDAPQFDRRRIAIEYN